MCKPHPVELRERAVRLVEQCHMHTETAVCVSIKFVNDMVRLRRETGSLAPKRQGNPGARQADRCHGLGAETDHGAARSDN